MVNGEKKYQRAYQLEANCKINTMKAKVMLPIAAGDLGGVYVCFFFF